MFNTEKEIIELYFIKNNLVKSILSKYTNDRIEEEELKKFNRYLDLQLRNNNSKNNLDSRISSINKIIQKQYDSFIKLNEIITD
ncbi:MAG TPA: hypothetical protein PKY25_00775 [Bacilli bacterium]|nr:hypothetical protein [Bacilli bacterium]